MDASGPRTRLLYALLVLAATRIVLSLWLARAGLFALSDDDFARVVIAQSFATGPHLDPSGTSWLPLPFWTMGGMMAVFGASLSVARVWTEIAAVLSSWLLFAAGRAAGLGTGRALAGAWLATLVPAAAVLGSVPVPELSTAALSAYALLALPADRPRTAWLAAIAVFAASLSRYEAWPIALVLAVVLARERRMGPALVAVLGPALWIVHNRLAHGDFLHFLHRVSAYRAALGGSGGSAGYLGALFTGEPVLAASVVLLAFVAARRRSLSAWTVPLVGAALLVLFLSVGARFGGAPTHHVGRTLLLVWVLAAIATADLAAVLPRPIDALVIALVAGACVLGYAREIEGTLDRRDEVAVGLDLARRMAVGERVVLATDDYGYFAVEAALGRPKDTIVHRTHDPRVTETSPLDLAREGAAWLVAPRDADVPGTERVLLRGRLAVYRRARL